ncbi:MAG TPA: helix-turn-helix domain-containing protein [Gaiellaceae bacterium]|nr:helix-turn-helix domain-containing protein [Gaiellaceae bacterium]
MTRAAVGSLELFRLCFPPSFSHGVIDPATGYLAVVLEGAVHKSFRHTSSTLGRGSFMLIPAGAAHSSAFARDGCQIVIVRAAGEDGERLFSPILRDCTKVVAHASTLLGWRISKELECSDACARLALEGLALELLACAGRAGAETVHRDAGWLPTVRDIVDESTPRVVSLHELGEIVERHPAHVARAFRDAYGVSVTTYARARRLEWATVAVASTDDPLARIALDAGFADQSHFTRSFRRHHGVTPGRYREFVRA